MRSNYDLDEYIGNTFTVSFIYGNLKFHSGGVLFKKNNTYGCGTVSFGIENVVRVENGVIRLRVGV